jgi:hypothetical protein
MITKPAGTPMTEAQFGFLIKLITQAHPNPASRSAALVSAAGFDFPTASAAIDALKATVKGMPAPAPVLPAYLPPFGHYLIDGKHVHVKAAKYGTAPLVIVDETWLGVVGKHASATAAIAKLDSVEAAYAYVVAYAEKTHKCGVCNTKLTDPKSIAAKIGPVCAKKYGK